MKERISSVIKSFLTAYALTAVFHMPLQREHYGDTIDYMIASIYELLGTYNFTFILIGVLAFFCYEKHRLRKMQTGLHSNLVAAFFAGSLLLGNSFFATDSWDYCFGSLVNFMKTAAAFTGYFMMFGVLVDFIFEGLEHGKIHLDKKHFFTKNAFWKCFGILSAVYAVALLLSFPGNLCWDVIGQIEQVTADGYGFSEHHPLMHTLLVGGLVKLGETVFGAPETGLFLYMLVQNVMLISALSATIAVLAKRKVRFGILLTLLIVYCISPIYSNLASTAIKDVPFTAFVIGYLICLALLLEKPERIAKPRFVITFVLIQIGTVWMRNNGLPLIVVCGVAAVIYLWKKYDWKKRLLSIATLVVVGVLIAKLITMAVAALLGAKAGGKAEMFSLPMQQTARYLTECSDALSAAEREGIEGVFGDVETVAEAYHPNSADYVKALFDNNAPMEDVLAYFKAWFIGLCKEPLIYLEAFVNHVYGWFTPGVTSALRYETQYEAIGQGMLFTDADKVMIFIYRFMDLIPGLGLIQNPGFYSWGLVLLTVYAWKKRRGDAIFMTAPLWVSLLVCLLAPCFFLHPRYALPLIMGLPFIFVFVIQGQKNSEEA